MRFLPWLLCGMRLSCNKASEHPSPGRLSVFQDLTSCDEQISDERSNVQVPAEPQREEQVNKFLKTMLEDFKDAMDRPLEITTSTIADSAETRITRDGVEVFHHEHNHWMYIGRAYMDRKRCTSYYLYRCKTCYDEGKEKLLTSTGCKRDVMGFHTHRIRNKVTESNPPRYGQNIVNVYKQTEPDKWGLPISTWTPSLTCDVCQITLSSQCQMTEHLKGLRHKIHSQKLPQSPPLSPVIED